MALKGLAISGGIAVARVCLFNESRHSSIPIYTVQSAEVEKEVERFRKARETAARQLDAVRADVAARIGEAEAEIFVAQRMILEDPTVDAQILDAIRKRHANAEAAINTVLDAFEARLQRMDNEYIKERASDIGEVRRRLLDILHQVAPSLQCGDADYCQRGRNRIVIAEELTPSLTLGLDTEHTMGFVTERGGVTSHAAILARALGIPAVSGIKGIHSLLACGTEVLVNGDTGEIVISPSDRTVARLRAGAKTRIRAPKPEPACAELSVLANISLSEETAEVIEMQAEGIGLYRTEFEFMAAERLLTEDEQFERYAAVLRAMDGKPVYVRLMDVGSDKPLPGVAVENEDNPSLGWRGARFLIGRPDLLATQARALARASAHGDLRVMYPMITDRRQFVKLKGLFREAVAGLRKGRIRHGAMFEVPAACLQAADILKSADFASVGTNDLIQYLFAVDRNNDRVAHDYDPDRPVFWALLKQIADAARAAGRPLSVCGEMAGDPRYVRKIREAGIDRVSVSPRLIPEIRRVARRLCGGRPRARRGGARG
ncbi:MAG: phosphoenolpyruvate--protein phosphotransferase [Kiritimatiellae bacterium]|nr:phosphoenolpyruvate--protein phosphotransferase [Kiritimatiellia bacterium]